MENGTGRVVEAINQVAEIAVGGGRPRRGGGGPLEAGLGGAHVAPGRIVAGIEGDRFAIGGDGVLHGATLTVVEASAVKRLGFCWRASLGSGAA